MNPLRFTVITVSDRSFRGERGDTSGQQLAQQIQAQGWQVAGTALVPDEIEGIRAALVQACDTHSCDVVLTTGGTGFSPRDVTPEATLGVIDRAAPGLAEAMRSASLQVTPHAMLSRAAAGIRGSVLIVNLPGSPKAALENFLVIVPVLPHAVELLKNAPAADSHHQIMNE